MSNWPRLVRQFGDRIQDPMVHIKKTGLESHQRIEKGSPIISGTAAS
jgi:hypothetical protein